MPSDHDDTVVAFARPAAREHVPDPDWAMIRKHFEAGASLRWLASQPFADGINFRTIGKRAKAEGWGRDIAKEVQARVRTEMLAGDEPLPEDPEALREALIERGVKKHVSVAKALQQKSEAAIEFLDFIESEIKRAIVTGEINPILSGGRLALGDVVKQFIGMTQTLQGGGGVRYTHDLDAQKSKIEPFIPNVGRRSVPGVSGDESDGD